MKQENNRITSMNKTGLMAGAALLITITSSQLQAATIMDNYIGANDHGYGDVIGNVNNFQINLMDAVLNGTVLTVSINTTFAGKGDNGLFSGLTAGNTGIGYGDLFLSSAWTPNGDGSDNYASDDASNGTVWTYGYSLDDRWMAENLAGTGTIYRLGSGNNASDVQMADDFLSGGYFRNGQEVAVDRESAGVTALANAGSWAITGTTVDFMIDLAGTDLLNGSEIALRWEFTCANDVIEGAVPVSAVPVPAAAWLFGSGLIGIAAVGRRKHR
jgi:hypothetical protein